MAVNTKRQGRYGKVVIGALTLCVTKWSAKNTGNSQDVTDTCSVGQEESLAGSERIEWSLDAFWSVEQNPFLNPPLLKYGSTPYVKLYVNKDDTNAAFDMPVTFVEEVGVDLDVKGVVAYNVSGKSNGTFTLNG